MMLRFIKDVWKKTRELNSALDKVETMLRKCDERMRSRPDFIGRPLEERLREDLQWTERELEAERSRVLRLQSRIRTLESKLKIAHGALSGVRDAFVIDQGTSPSDVLNDVIKDIEGVLEG